MTQRGRRRRASRAACLAVSAAVLLGVTMLPASAQQQRNGDAYQQWEKMPKQQRDRILREQERYRHLPPGEQERLRREYEQRHQN